MSKKNNYAFKCPKCGHIQRCGCEACLKHDKRPQHQGVKPWIWKNGELVKCAGCGLTNHADWWQDEELRQAKAAGLWHYL